MSYSIVLYLTFLKMIDEDILQLVKTVFENRLGFE